MGTRPPSWLSKAERSEYVRLAGSLPGFNPVLDKMALSIYVRTCTTVAELKEHLKDETLATESRITLENMLRDEESAQMAWAGDMGLTPASHLLIVRSLKQQARGKRGNSRP